MALAHDTHHAWSELCTGFGIRESGVGSHPLRDRHLVVTIFTILTPEGVLLSPWVNTEGHRLTYKWFALFALFQRSKLLL